MWFVFSAYLEIDFPTILRQIWYGCGGESGKIPWREGATAGDEICIKSNSAFISNIVDFWQNFIIAYENGRD